MHGKTLIEYCPQCKENVSQIPVAEDEPGDDSNARAELKDYKLVQMGKRPYQCQCGTKLVPRLAA